MTSTAVGAPVLLSVNVGMPKDVSWQRQDRLHGRVEAPGGRPADGAPAQHRRRRPGRHERSRRRAAGRARLPDRSPTGYWQRHFGRDDFSYGQFGENLTVDGLPDDEVCIGDRYRIGEAEFEVTQPRVTCYRVGLRIGEPELPALLVGHHRPGFYMRVVTRGTRSRPATRSSRPRTGPARAERGRHRRAALPARPRPRQAARAATRIPALSPGWQESFRDSGSPSDAGRRSGPATRPTWTGFRSLRVTKVVPREPPTVSSIYLTAPDGSPLPAARAGQYLTLRVPGAGRPAPVRSYSLSSAPGAGSYRISVKREPHGTVSGYLTSSCGPARSSTWRRPAATSSSIAGTGPVLLISAGIGVTPVLAMLHELAAAPQRPRGLVDPRRPRTAGARRWPPRRTPCSPRCRTPTSTCSTARHADERRGHAEPAASAGRADRPRRSGRRERLRLRPGLVHDRHAGRPHRDRHRPGPHPHRAVRRAGLDQPRPHRRRPPGHRTSRPAQPEPGRW